MPQRSQTVSRSKVFLRRLEAAAIFAASFALAAFVVAEKPDVEHLLGVLGPLALPLATAIFAIVAAAPFSVTDALAIMNGVLFGPLWGSVVSAVGIVLAAVIGYFIALRTSRLLEIEASVARLPAWVRHFRVGSPAFLIMVRIIPGLGGTLATQTAAALRVPLLRQVYTMALIAIPICTVLAVGGNAVATYIDAHVFEPAAALAAKHHVHLLRRPHHNATPTPHFYDP
jgi:uncharacterized membrane protein YdjX (TVP38/TMEM64 family)